MTLAATPITAPADPQLRRRFGGYSYGGVGICCSDSLVTALEDEASTSSFVPDYLVAGADDMNFINNKEMSAGGGGVGGCGSAAGSFAAEGGRVQWS